MHVYMTLHKAIKDLKWSLDNSTRNIRKKYRRNEKSHEFISLKRPNIVLNLLKQNQLHMIVVLLVRLKKVTAFLNPNLRKLI